MDDQERYANYRKQQGGGALTGPQKRRLKHKRGHALAVADGTHRLQRRTLHARRVMKKGLRTGIIQKKAMSEFLETASRRELAKVAKNQGVKRTWFKSKSTLRQKINPR